MTGRWMGRRMHKTACTWQGLLRKGMRSLASLKVVGDDLRRKEAL